MGLWNLGSVATEVLILIENVPTNMSGAPLERAADRKRQYVEDYTGTIIGSNSIGIRFQDVILNFTAAVTAKTMEALGVDANQVKLGDFSTGKGSDSNLASTAKGLQEMAEAELNNLGRKVRFRRTL